MILFHHIAKISLIAVCVGFVIGIILGYVLSSSVALQDARLEGFDEGFKAAKKARMDELRMKLDRNQLYGRFERGRKDDIQ